VTSADSLFSECIGLAGGRRATFAISVFPRASSLKTWLRAVLAQRHIDSIRAGRRLRGAFRGRTGDGPRRRCLSAGAARRPRIASGNRSFTRALQTALERLEPQERKGSALLRRGKKRLRRSTLLGEHESSVSRHLDRAGAICAKPSRTFFAKASARRTVPRFSPTERCGNRPLFRIQRRRHPIDLQNCCPPEVAGPRQPESGRRDRRGARKPWNFRSKDGEAYGA